MCPRMSDSSRALLRSQVVTWLGCRYVVFPRRCIPVSMPNRSALLSYVAFGSPLPCSARSCRCGLPLDSCGHHRAACAVQGVLGRRGLAVESAAARVCRKAGARGSMNVRVQDMDLSRPDVMDQRRLEIVADSLLLCHGAQLRGVNPQAQCDSTTTLRQRGWHGGARRSPILSWVGRTGGQGSLVLGCEVSGRWSEECRNFLSQPAKGKVRGDPPHLKVRARHARHSRWATLLACSAARAVALSLLERRGGTGADGDGGCQLHSVQCAFVGFLTWSDGFTSFLPF